MKKTKITVKVFAIGLLVMFSLNSIYTANYPTGMKTENKLSQYKPQDAINGIDNVVSFSSDIPGQKIQSIGYAASNVEQVKCNGFVDGHTNVVELNPSLSNFNFLYPFGGGFSVYTVTYEWWMQSNDLQDWANQIRFSGSDGDGQGAYLFFANNRVYYYEEVTHISYDLAAVAQNQWNHFRLIVDGNTFRLYLNDIPCTASPLSISYCGSSVFRVQYCRGTPVGGITYFDGFDASFNDFYYLHRNFEGVQSFTQNADGILNTIKMNSNNPSKVTVVPSYDGRNKVLKMDLSESGNHELYPFGLFSHKSSVDYEWWSNSNDLMDWAIQIAFRDDGTKYQFLLFSWNNLYYYESYRQGGECIQIAPIPINQWNHFRIDIDGDVLQIYINGQLCTASPILMGLSGSDYFRIKHCRMSNNVAGLASYWDSFDASFRTLYSTNRNFITISSFDSDLPNLRLTSIQTTNTAIKRASYGGQTTVAEVNPSGQTLVALYPFGETFTYQSSLSFSWDHYSTDLWHGREEIHFYGLYGSDIGFLTFDFGGKIYYYHNEVWTEIGTVNLYQWNHYVLTLSGNQFTLTINNANPITISTSQIGTSHFQIIHHETIGPSPACGISYWDNFVSTMMTFDMDSDGLTDGNEGSIYRTNLLDADTDGDGLNDGVEVNTYHTYPLDSDSDDDRLTDGQEVLTYGTNPLAADTDGDDIQSDDGIQGDKSDFAEIMISKTNPNTPDYKFTFEDENYLNMWSSSIDPQTSCIRNGGNLRFYDYNYNPNQNAEINLPVNLGGLSKIIELEFDFYIADQPFELDNSLELILTDSYGHEGFKLKIFEQQDGIYARHYLATYYNGLYHNIDLHYEDIFDISNEWLNLKIHLTFTSSGLTACLIDLASTYHYYPEQFSVAYPISSISNIRFQTSNEAIDRPVMIQIDNFAISQLHRIEEKNPNGDLDLDHVTNAEEIQNNLNPTLIDSDFDGVEDFDEIFYAYTDENLVYIGSVLCGNHYSTWIEDNSYFKIQGETDLEGSPIIYNIQIKFDFTYTKPLASIYLDFFLLNAACCIITLAYSDAPIETWNLNPGSYIRMISGNIDYIEFDVCTTYIQPELWIDFIKIAHYGLN